MHLCSYHRAEAKGHTLQDPRTRTVTSSSPVRRAAQLRKLVCHPNAFEQCVLWNQRAPLVVPYPREMGSANAQHTFRGPPAKARSALWPPRIGPFVRTARGQLSNCRCPYTDPSTTQQQITTQIPLTAQTRARGQMCGSLPKLENCFPNDQGQWPRGTESPPGAAIVDAGSSCPRALSIARAAQLVVRKPIRASWKPTWEMPVTTVERPQLVGAVQCLLPLRDRSVP